MLARTKTVLAAALVISTASVALIQSANASPRSDHYNWVEKSHFDRASKSYDGAGF